MQEACNDQGLIVLRSGAGDDPDKEEKRRRDVDRRYAQRTKPSELLLPGPEKVNFIRFSCSLESWIIEGPFLPHSTKPES